jgi:hypothetical protein
MGYDAGGFLGGTFSVRSFGALGDGVANDAPAIQAAIDAAEAFVPVTQYGATVFFPPGRYRCTEGLTVQETLVFLQGSGWGSTILTFAPTLDNQVLINFDRGAPGLLTYCGIRDMRLTSSGTPLLTKTALRTKDVVEFLCHNVNIGPWTGNDNSIGWEVRGREAYSVNNVNINADFPLRIKANDQNPNNDLDHADFHDFQAIPTNGVVAPCIEIDDGIQLQEVSFTGYQPWVGGSYGLLWNDASSTGLSTGLRIDNLRTEQATDPDGYSIRIDKTGGAQLQHLVINGNLLSGDMNGIYLRNVQRVSLRDTNYGGAGTFLNIDDVYDFVHENLLTNALSSVSMGTLVQKMSMGINQDSSAPIAETGWWSAPATNGQLPMRVFGTRVWAAEYVMDDTDIQNLLPVGDGSGRIVANVGIVVHGDAGPVDAWGDVMDSMVATGGPVIKTSSANFSAAAGTPNSFNYINSGGGPNQIQNLLGETVRVLVWVQWSTGTL